MPTNQPRSIAKNLQEAKEFQLQDALEISNLKNKVSDIEKYMRGMSSELSDIKDNTNLILSYIQNDPKTNKKGLYEQTQDNITRIEGLEDYKKSIVSKVGLLVSIGGSLAGLVTTALINYIANK